MRLCICFRKRPGCALIGVCALIRTNKVVCYCDMGARKMFLSPGNSQKKNLIKNLHAHWKRVRLNSKGLEF